MFSINKALGIVPNASESGYSVDHLLEFCHWFMAILFVGWSIFFFYTLFRFHKSRNPHASYYGVRGHASTHVEFSVILIEAALLLGFALPLWGKRTSSTGYLDNPNALRIRAVAEQFAWNYHYPGPDGVFGSSKAIYVSSNNPLGLDPNDPAGKDDLISKNEMFIVDHRPTVVEVTSKDVIHNFALKSMRIAQDAIPGARIPIWFRPIRTGDFDIVCGQLCGSGHFGMRSILHVVEQPAFDDWQKETLKFQHPELTPAAAAPAPAVAAPTSPAPAAPVPAAPAAK